MRRILLCLGLVFAAMLTTAQNDNNVLVYGIFIEDINDKPLKKAYVKLFRDSEAGEKLVVKHDSGYFSIELDFGHMYYLEFAAKGRVTKRVQINTHNVPDRERKGGFGMNVDIRMIKPRSKKNFTFLKEELMGMAKYDTETLNFKWDQAYTDAMRQKIIAAHESDGD